MQFATGILDSLFGEKVIVELPGPNGTTIKRTVTQKWLEKMEQEGKATQITKPVVQVHVVAPSGYTVEHCIIGEDIDAATYERSHDPSTTDLYKVIYYEAGERKEKFLKKHQWEQIKVQMDAVSDERYH